MMEQLTPSDIVKQFGEAMVRAAQAFNEYFDKVIPVLRKFVNEWAWMTGSTSAEKYALAGYPFGRHTKGKKKWLREMKRRHRQ